MLLDIEKVTKQIKQLSRNGTKLILGLEKCSFIPRHRAETFHHSVFLFYFILFILFIYTYNVWVISPSFPPPPPLATPPHFQAEIILPLCLILLRQSISNNRKDQGFLLVEIRIAILGADSH
jgi:hypothetical protein